MILQTRGYRSVCPPSRTIQILILALAASVGGATAQAQVGELELVAVPDTTRHQVLRLLSAYYQAFSDRDWDRFAGHFWPGATLTTVWQPPGAPGEMVVITSLADFVAKAPEGPGSREIFEERMSAAAVLLAAPDLATVFARYYARFGDPGAVHRWEGTDVFTLMRFNGEWRIVALAYASD